MPEFRDEQGDLIATDISLMLMGPFRGQPRALLRPSPPRPGERVPLMRQLSLLTGRT